MVLKIVNYGVKLIKVLVIVLLLGYIFTPNLESQISLQHQIHTSLDTEFLMTEVDNNFINEDNKILKKEEIIKIDTIKSLSTAIDSNKQDNKIEELEVFPDENDFIPVEKQPDVDLVLLRGCLEYPDSARKEGLEGEVLINVLVGVNGKVRKTSIIKSTNDIFNNVAIKAVMECGVFTPAIQKGKPIMCWTAIPFKFKLSNK